MKKNFYQGNFKETEKLFFFSIKHHLFQLWSLYVITALTLNDRRHNFVPMSFCKLLRALAEHVKTKTPE